MKRVFFIFILLHSLVQAQDFPSVHNGIMLKIAPLNWMDVYNGPLLPFSIEADVSNKSSICLEFGKHFKDFGLNHNWIDLNGWQSRIEYRNHFDEMGGHLSSHGYWGASISAGHQSYIRTDSIRMSRSGMDSTYTKTYANVRDYVGLMGHIGMQYRWNSRINLDLSFGFGLRRNSVQNELTEEESRNREIGDWTVPTNWIQKQGINLVPKFNYSIRIGYLLRK